MGLAACSLSRLCIHGQATSAREENSVTVGFGGEFLWIGVRGLRKACHKLAFLLLSNPPRTPNPPKIRLWFSQNSCGVKMEKLGVRAPAENGEDSGSETGIENSQGKASSRVSSSGGNDLEPTASIFAKWPSPWVSDSGLGLFVLKHSAMSYPGAPKRLQLLRKGGAPRPAPHSCP